jgi:hypothetical protein
LLKGERESYISSTGEFVNNLEVLVTLLVVVARAAAAFHFL